MKAHGYADLSWEKNVLTLDVYGPFNEEGVKLVFQHVKESVLNKKIKRWCRIEKLDEETMGSALAVSFVNELYVWADQHGCYATAVIISNLIQAQAITDVLKGKNAKLFHHIDEAQKWISQQ